MARRPAPAPLSRRTVLAGLATSGTAVSLLSTGARGQPSRTNPDDARHSVGPRTSHSLRELAGHWDEPGYPSRRAFHALASADRHHAQQGTLPTFTTELDAVADLGCDPTGRRPVQRQIMDAAADGVLIVFPPGRYRITASILVFLRGSFGMVGAGYQAAAGPPTLDDGVVFVVDTPDPVFVPNARLTSGLFANFVIDQRGLDTQGALKFWVRGFVQVRDIRIVGPQSIVSEAANHSFFTPVALTETAVVRLERCVAVGGGRAGTKNTGGAPCIWVGKSTRGLVQLVNCHVENGAGNGIYGSRTPGTVHVIGGFYRNNDVSQVRISGPETFADGVTIIIDEANYTGIGDKAGFPATNGIKWETKPPIAMKTGGEVRNCDIRCLSAAGHVGALINVWAHGGAIRIRNCRLQTEVRGTRAVLGELPGSKAYRAAPKPWTVSVNETEVTGRGAQLGGPTIDVRGRPTSIVADSCLRYPGASPADIRGTRIHNVGYGTECSPEQLPQGPIGTVGNLSELEISVGEFSGEFGSSTSYSSIHSLITAITSIVIIVIGAMAGTALALLALAAILGVLAILTTYWLSEK